MHKNVAVAFTASGATEGETKRIRSRGRSRFGAPDLLALVEANAPVEHARFTDTAYPAKPRPDRLESTLPRSELTTP